MLNAIITMAKKRKCYSIAEKASIIEKAKEFHGTKVELAKSLGLPITTLQTILKQKDTVEINSEKLGNIAKKRKTLKTSPYEEVEKVLIEWFKNAHAANIPINGTILREKALEISIKLGLTEFTASNGWVHRFKNRHNLTYRSTRGESASVDSLAIKEWKEKSLPSLVANYAPKDIFNADETGLFFNLLPDKTCTVKGESCHGGKMSKIRLTVLFCCNADGSEKLIPLVIGQTKKLRCFQNVKSLPTSYESNKKALMTQTIFESFLLNLDKQMGLQKRNILLFIDQCTAHVDLKLNNVHIEFFPSNCKSQLQPLELGIIHQFKICYRKQLVQKTFIEFYSENLKDAWKKKINVLEALHLISSAWNNVTKSCIANCFMIGGFPTLLQSFIHVENDLMLKDDYFNKFEIDFEAYAECDKNVITSENQMISNLIDLSSEESVDDTQKISQPKPSFTTSEESDDDTQEISQPKPSFTTALNGLQLVKNFLLSYKSQELHLQKLSIIENALYEIHAKDIRQTKITDFFKTK